MAIKLDVLIHNWEVVKHIISLCNNGSMSEFANISPKIYALRRGYQPLEFKDASESK